MKLELVTNEEGSLGWVGEAGARRQGMVEAALPAAVRTYLAGYVVTCGLALF